jgi:hypothetical protein
MDISTSKITSIKINGSEINKIVDSKGNVLYYNPPFNPGDYDCAIRITDPSYNSIHLSILISLSKNGKSTIASNWTAVITPDGSLTSSYEPLGMPIDDFIEIGYFSANYIGVNQNWHKRSNDQGSIRFDGFSYSTCEVYYDDRRYNLSKSKEYMFDQSVSKAIYK